MSAKLEICLYVGLLQTRFDAFDEVELKLKNGSTVKGTLLPMESTRYFEVNTEKGVRVVYPEDVEDYVARQEMAGYTVYCTCFYDAENKKVCFYDEIKDRYIRRQKVKDKEEAEKLMQAWVDNAPADVICQMI